MRYIPLLFTAAACINLAGPTVEPPVGGTVLFIGNSLTYSNDLPQIVQALAAASGDASIESRTVAYPNFSLVDHLENGQAMAAVRRGGWKTVILQQGPSTLPANRAQLRSSTQQLAAAAMGVGARTALYAVWPTQGREQDFPAANESYSLAAGDVNGTLLPVGESWLAAWRRDPQVTLYAADGLHPTLAGSYLAGLVIASRLTGRSPVGMPASLTLANGSRVEIPTSLATVLQEAAAEAVGVP